MAEISIRGKKAGELLALSKQMLLSLNEKEMLAIQRHCDKLGREPTDLELETIAQTWSEHCKHKVFNGVIEYDEDGKKEFIDNLFRRTIRKATEQLSRELDWLVSVFKDNAGIIAFNGTHHACMKVETHNHPSALDPYGGANTGLGGVIRDVLGCGLGAKPVANTDVFCFGPFDLPYGELPKGVLHPKRIAKGVREGVRDYGNRMGIPTVNGAILFDPRYTFNPLVYCGTVGIIPRGLEDKAAQPGDRIVVVGGRTGRDGIHGATFSSAELDESVSTSVVQIGNAIEEKKFMDVLLKARDQRLYTCVTDCGAGGFSSAVGEMASGCGARVDLEQAPLKYHGMQPWEIWVSESQERMVLAVPKENAARLLKMFADEDVEARVIGEFTTDKQLSIHHNGALVGQLDMGFLHGGAPRLEQRAVWKSRQLVEPEFPEPGNLGAELKKLLALPNIASKETTIRQYDHEVQGGAVLKPLVGAEMDGPGDAAIVRPFFDGWEGLAVSNGINPLYGDIDPYWMAAAAIDEAVRNLVAVGCGLERIALLDNFCWGDPKDPAKLGELIRAAKACCDVALAYKTPYISGKDSFHNEYNLGGKSVSIPSTLLISALGVMKDVRKRVSMDFKEKGNLVYVVGKTFDELGGSHYYKLRGHLGKNVPKLDATRAKRNYLALSKAASVGLKNRERLVRALHDCSEGGLGVALAEMAFAGGLGCEIDLRKAPVGGGMTRNDQAFFSESNSRLLVEVAKGKRRAFERAMKGTDFACIGKVTGTGRVIVKGLDGKVAVDEGIQGLKKAWKGTLDW